MARGSVAYANLRRALLAAVRVIPEGRLVEAGALAAALNVPARHVAYMLATLSPLEADLVPAHRVIPRAGDFGPPDRRTPARAAQVARLLGEGHAMADGRRLSVDPGRLWQPDDAHRATFWAEEPAS